MTTQHTTFQALSASDLASIIGGADAPAAAAPATPDVRTQNAEFARLSGQIGQTNNCLARFGNNAAGNACILKAGQDAFDRVMKMP